MAIIYSYSLNTDLLASDMLVGTATKLYAGKPKNETKNFSLGELAYFISTSEYNTLDAVLNNGNTSLLGANVGEVGIWDPTALSYAKVKVLTSEFQFYSANYPLSPMVAFDFNSIVFNNMNFTSTILTGTPTANRTYTLPNNSGTIALTSDIPPYTTPTLNEVLTEGNTSLLSANVGELGIWDPSNLGYLKVDGGDNSFIFKRSDLGTICTLEDGLIALQSGSIVGSISTSSLTSTQTYSLPDASGTIALTADLTGYVTSVTATSPITSTGGTTPVISTSMATNKLIGRSTAGTGVMEEITIGSGLALSGGTLSSSALSGSILHGIAAGTDTYTVTITGATAYADGDAYLINFTNGNTTSATLNINGQGAIALWRNNDGPLIGGDIVSGGEILCVYRAATNVFQCIGTAPNTLLAYVTNAETTTITKGQAVYVSGGTGDRIKVKLASNVTDATSAQTIGIVQSTSIAANQKGLIIVQGQLDNLSLFPTATWADGDFIYLGATPGTLTNVKPFAPNHLVYLGYVTTASNGSAGRMYVKVQNGYEMNEIHDVYINPATLANGDLLQYNSSTDLWLNKSLSAAGIQPTLPSFTSGSVIFSNGTTLAQDNANFFWDDTNNRLGIGTNTPTTELDVNGVIRGLLPDPTGVGGITAKILSYSPSPYGLVFRGYSSGAHSIQSQREANDAQMYPLILQPNGSNVGIRTLTPTTELDVNGVITATGGNSTSWNAKQNALLDIASVQDNGIYSTFMNGAISYFLGGIGAATFNNLRINSNFLLSGNTAYFSNPAIQFSTTATAGTLAWQRGVPFYHAGRSLFRFQPNIVSSDARYFVGLSYLYQVSNPTNVEPTTLTQTIGVAKLSTSSNLFIIHNDGTGTATSVDLGVNYPATSNLYIYDIKITSTFAGVYTGVTVRRTTISTGATISTDYAVPSNYPTGVGTNPVLWITNNATAAANSLYYFGAIGYNTTI